MLQYVLFASKNHVPTTSVLSVTLQRTQYHTVLMATNSVHSKLDFSHLCVSLFLNVRFNFALKLCIIVLFCFPLHCKMHVKPEDITRVGAILLPKMYELVLFHYLQKLGTWF
jgi:hypothetical protein